MSLIKTQPTTQRKLKALLILFCAGTIASIFRVSRADFNLFPVLQFLDVYGTSPNFFVCLACPFIAFMFPDEVDWPYFAKVSLGNFVGMTIYEAIQLYIPARTFDLYDIAASFTGMLCSLMLARFAFFLNQESP